ncbi:hypothetical protein DFH27DRAFT_523313 [Peziza echinospora]|nr:hypothetical protein DFH27DRAFT_523313 [Peziza echinospora]
MRVELEETRLERDIHRKQARRKQVQDGEQRNSIEIGVAGDAVDSAMTQVEEESLRPSEAGLPSTSTSTPSSSSSPNTAFDSYVYTPTLQRQDNTYHRLVRRAGSGSGDTPVIIGVLVGGIAFIAIMIAAYFIWRRRDMMARQPAAGSHAAPPYKEPITPNVIDRIDDKASFTLPPPAVHTRTPSVPRYTPFIHPVAPSPIPMEKAQNRHQSWLHHGGGVGSNGDEQALVQSAAAAEPPSLKLNTRIPTRATKSPSPSMSSSKRASSIFKRLGSRDLASPVSIQSLPSVRGPAPPRPPRPEDVGDSGLIHQQVFELSASPSVKRKKRGSKPLPVLPTFLIREQEEEMRKRRLEEQRERKEEYEKLRKPQSPVNEEKVTETSVGIAPPQFPEATVPRRMGSIDVGIDTQSIGAVLRKSSSFNSLCSSSTASTVDSDDENPRRPTPEVNALSPRSSQGKSARALSHSSPRHTIPTSSELAKLHADDDQRSSLERKVRDGSNVVEASAVTPGTFPSPKMIPLKVTPPTFTRSSTPESNNSFFGMSPPPISATVASPPRSVLASHPVYLNAQVNSPATNASIHRTESTNSSAIFITGVNHINVGSEPYLVLEDEKSDLAPSAIEDWRESVGDGYAATRPTTAGATPGGGTSTEDVLTWPATLPSFIVQDVGPVRERPSMPRKISVDTGVGGIPPVAAAGTGNGISSSLLSAITPSTNNSLSPYPHYDAVPISAVQAPVGMSMQGHAILRPSTPERQRELRVQMEKAKKAELDAKNRTQSEGYDVMSWMNFDDDSDSAADEPGPSTSRR